MPYDFWKWSDPESLHKQQAADLVENARQMQEQSDRSQLQQHVGNIIENFHADIANRMAPYMPSAPSPAAPQPAAPQPAAPQPAAPQPAAPQPAAPQPAVQTPEPQPAPQFSPVDDVLARFGRGAKNIASGVADAVDPVMGLIGTKGLYEGYARQNQILDEAKPYIDPSVSENRRALMGRAGPGGLSPDLPDAYRQANPDKAAEYDQIGSSALATMSGGIGGGVATGAINAAGKFVPTALRLGQQAARAGVNAATHSPAPAIVGSVAEKAIDASMGHATPSVNLGLKDATYKFFDDLQPVKKLMDSREKVLGRTLTDNENAYNILRLGRASREIADEWVTTHVGDALQSLPQISGSVDQGTQDLNRYLRAKDAIDKAAAKGNPDRLFGGMTAKESEQALVDMQARLGQQNFSALEASAQKFYDLGDFLLDRKVKAGLIDADTAQKLKDLYPHHMPIQTIDWLDDKLANTSTRVGKAGGAANDIKELTDFGTDRASEMPIDAFHRAADRTAALVAKNEAGTAIVAAARDVPWAQGLIRPADNASAKMSGLATGPASSFARLPGETMQQFRINGNIVKFHADRSLDPVFNYGVSVGDGPWKDVLGKLSTTADWTRKLAIGYNPSWGVYQLAMDSIGFLTKNGGLSKPGDLVQNVKRLGVAADEVGLSPFSNRVAGAAEGAIVGGLTDPTGDATWTDRARNAAIGAGIGAGLKSTGIGQRAGRGALYSEARAAGALPGAVDHVTGAPGSYGKIVQGRTGIDVNGPADFARKATDSLLRNLQGINEKFDAIPRLAEYQSQKAAGSSVQQAALAARDITIDPSRGGTYTRAINAVVPFFNVAFQSAAYAPRMLRNPETRTRAASGIASSVIMPTLALEAYNQQDPRYADVPNFDKDRGFVVMTPGKGQIDPATGREKPTYLLVRTGPFTPFVVLSRALYNATPVGQGVDLAQTASALTRSASPIDFSPVVDAIGSGQDPLRAAGNVGAKYLPSGVKQVAESAFNRDTFRDRPIVPEGLQNQPAENQFTQDTSETAKLLGAKIGVSPAIIDHLLKSWGGGADALVGVADNALSATGIAQAGESQRLTKLRRDLAKTGISDEEAARAQGEIDRELAIKADRDSALRNVPIVGSLGSRYYREQGGQSLDTSEAAIGKALLDKKRDSSPVATELKRLGKTFGDVKDEISGIKLTRAMGVDYREKALNYRTKLLDDLVKTPMYTSADDVEKGRLVDSAMQQAAGWAAYDAAQTNPALVARLQETAPTGAAFVAPGVDKNVEIASRRYLGALKAQQDLDEIKGNERYRNVAPADAAQTASDQATLSRFKALMNDNEAEMAFQAKYGATRLNRAMSAKESKFWRSRMDSFRRDNPDYSLFIESAPQTFTRKGLDATTVARMAGL